MTFASPWFLVLGLLVVPLCVLAARSRAPIGRNVLVAVTVLQVLALLAATLALAGPWRSAAGAVHRVAVWAVAGDGAGHAEIGRWRARGAWNAPFHVVAAGRTPVVGAPQREDVPAAAGTPDVTAALLAAAALIPSGARGEIALFHDGRHDGAGLALAQNVLTVRGLGLEVITSGAQPPAGPRLRAVTGPANVAPGEAFVLRADIVSSSAAANLRLEARHGGTVVGTAEVQVPAGASEHRLEVVLTRSGAQQLDVALVGANVEPAHGQERLALLVEEPLAVLHLTGDASRRAALATTLAPHGIALTAPEPGQPLADALLQQHHVAVIDDLAADAWPVGEQQRLAEAVVRTGLGVVLAGTHANLGPGGYGSSPLAGLLPVRMPQREERRDPSVAVVLIIDTSGSMGGGRIELAKEVARLCVQKLQPHDKVGIVEFYGSKRWAAPLQPATNTIEITRALNRLQAGGGTIIYDALEESYYALLSAQARFLHALVLTDGGVESGPFEALARRMAAAGQTVSTVLIGPQANSPFLLSLAQWGRGRFYACPDRFQLPDLQFREPQSALLPSVREQVTPLLRAGESEVTAAFAGDQLLPTGGLVEASLRQGAEVLVRTAGGEPFLVGWDQGAGRVLTMAGQLLGPMSGALRTDPAYGAYLADLLRSAAGGARALQPRLELRTQESGVDVELRLPAGAQLPERVQLVVDGGRSLPMVDVGLDRCAGFLAWADDAVVQFTVRTGDVVLARGAACPPADRGARALRSEELRSLAATARAVGERQAERFDRPLLWIALVAFALGLLVRRVPWDALARPRAALVLAVLVAVLAAPTRAQDPVPPADETAIAAAIDAALRTRGDLDELGTAWRQASPLHRYRLARAQGDLAEAARVLTGSELAIKATELAPLLDVLGRPKEALAALGQAPTDPAARAEWLLQRAALLATTKDLAGAEADLRAAVAAAGTPAFTDRAGLVAGAFGLLDLALAWHRGDGDGKDAFQTGLRRAMWLARAQRFDEAAAAAQQAFAVAPLQRDRFYALAQLVAARRAAGKLPELVSAWLPRARGEGPPLHRTELRVLCDVLRELGRAAEGVALLASLDAPTRKDLADVEFALAIDAGDPAAAIARLRARVQAEPRDAVTRGSLALLLADEQREAEAAGELTAGIAGADLKTLRALFQAASELALETAVTAIVAAVAAHGEPGCAVEAALLLAAHHRRQGRDQDAVKVLLAARSQADRAADRLRIAEQLESLGRKPETIELYTQIWDELHTEDLGLRLAWLLAESKDDQERARAQQLFFAIWTGAGSAARRVQAEEHVLDLAAREGTLADLAIDLESQLADPGTGNRQAVRDALIKIYTRARDTTGAAALLRQWAKDEPERAIEAHAQLARVYLAAEEFRNHERVLEQLLTLDPANELDYRQQLAMSALERGRPEQARRYLRGLFDRPGAPDQIALEFAAGIYALAAEHGEAVRMYRRALAQYPDRVETYLLLGNALRSAGQRERAIGVFLDLLLRPLPDDLFVVAVDGLLNMEAPAATLLAADRLVRLRLCARPEQVFLHRLRQDLLEALGDEDGRLQALQETVVVAGEQRTSFLRELMQEAETRRDWSTFARHGRTLLMLGDEVPPAVFLSLGEALLRTGDLDAATRAFARARLATDFTAVETRTAELYEGQNRFAEAERVRRRILRRRPEDKMAQLAVARLCERQGARERALPLYRQVALALLPKHLQTASTRREMAGSPGPRMTVLGNRNSAAEGPEFGEPFAGVLRCAQDAADLQPVVDALVQAARPADGQGSERPLVALALLRKVAAVTGDAALLTATRGHEEALLAARGDDERLRNELVARRVATGELAFAAAIVPAAGKPTYEVLRLRLLRGELDRLMAAAAVADVGLLPELGRSLLLLGHRGLAEQLVAIADAGKGSDAITAGEELRRMLGLPFDPKARGRRQLEQALARTAPLAARTNAILAALAAAGLPDGERGAHVLELATAVVAAADGNLAERILDQCGGDLDEATKARLVEVLFQKIDNAYQVGQRARHLGGLPVAKASDVLANALRRFGVDERRQQQLSILRNPGSLPQEHLAAVVAALDVDKLVPIDRIWLGHIAQQRRLPVAVLQALATKVGARHGGDPSVQLLVCRLQDTDAARSAAALAALRTFAAEKDDSERDESAFTGLAELVDPAAARGLLTELPSTGGSLEVRMALLRRVGDKDVLAETMLAASRARPDDVGLLYRAAAFLEEDGRLAQAAELYRAIRARSATFYPHQAQQLARLELRLGNAAAAVAALRAADDRLGSNYRVFLQALARLEDAGLRAALLQELVQQRAGSSRSTMFVRAGANDDDGLRLADVLAVPSWPSLGVTDPTATDAAPTDHDILAVLPEGEAAARAILRTLEPAMRDAEPGLYRGLLGAARRQGRAGAVLAGALVALASAPGDAEALRLVLAAAQIGLDVPAPALRAAFERVATEQRPVAATLVSFLPAAERAGDVALTDAVLRLLLSRPRTEAGLAPWLPRLYARACEQLPAETLAAAAAASEGLRPTIDLELLAALVVGHPEPAAVRTALAPAFARLAASSIGSTDETLWLPWCGLHLLLGEVDTALAALAVQSDFRSPARSVSPRAYAAAIPALERWARPDSVTRVGEVLVAAAQAGREADRDVAVRLGAVLVARLRQSGRAAEAGVLQERLVGAATGLSLRPADWFPSR